MPPSSVSSNIREVDFFINFGLICSKLINVNFLFPDPITIFQIPFLKCQQRISISETHNIF